MSHSILAKDLVEYKQLIGFQGVYLNIHNAKLFISLKLYNFAFWLMISVQVGNHKYIITYSLNKILEFASKYRT